MADTVGVAGEIGQHCLGPGAGRLAVDEPPPAPQRAQMPHEGTPLGEAGIGAVEGEPARRMGCGQLLQHKPAEQRRQTRTGRNEPNEFAGAIL